MNTDSSNQHQGPHRDSLLVLREFLEQTRLLAEIRRDVQLVPCLLDRIGRIACLTANEVHQNTLQLKALRQSLEALVEMYRTVNPAAALELDRLGKLRSEIERCCPPEPACESICHYVPCEPLEGIRPGDGYSMKSRGSVLAVPYSERPHAPWKIVPHVPHEADENLPVVPLGPIVGPIVPSAPTPQPLDYQSGTPTPGPHDPVTFRTFTEGDVVETIWPPDMTGAKAADVVLMAGNLWFKLSTDGGKTFTGIDFTKVFSEEKTYGGWAGDPVVHYVPAIDCFLFYVQSKHTGSNPNKNVVKVAVASPVDLKTHKGGKAAWYRQWDFTSDTFGLGDRWMDFPDLTHDDKFLYVFTNAFTGEDFQGKLFFELPLASLKAGGTINFLFAFVNETKLTFGSPAQNISGENYWAAHVNNSTLRIYSSKGTESTYAWRERTVNNWPMSTKKGQDIVSAAPDSSDWVSTSHQIIGATRVNNQVWFAWTADAGKGGAGGFEFPHPHVQIAKFDLGQDYKFVEQTQVWNADHAYSYPSLTTNSDNEVGISLAWGGGTKHYGSHAVGILGDFVVWYGTASQRTSTRLKPTRWGDYVHVRLAYPDTRFFSAFGYAVLDDAGETPPEKAEFLYVEFGREKPGPPVIK